ncbi:hypothetical protein LXL04_024322 [Taraxacum kok-saghyz]
MMNVQETLLQVVLMCTQLLLEQLDWLSNMAYWCFECATSKCYLWILRLSNIGEVGYSPAIQLDNFKSGRFYTMITSAFSHIEVGHIVYDMIGLYLFCKSIGNFFGPAFLLKFYLAGALVCSPYFLVHHAFLAPSSKANERFEDIMCALIKK